MKKCKNGHYYSDDLSSCPYCPSTGEEKQGTEKTIISTGGNSNKNNDMFKTKIFGGENTSKSPQTKATIGSKKRDLNKTYIDLGDDSSIDTGDMTPMRAKRKLVGWLVSYTIDEMGRDYRVFEGKNRVGTGADCEITIPNDPSVSSTHLTLLYRNGKYKVKDELSTNGTYVNGKDIDDEITNLKDGDTIKVGKTIFKFKSAL